MHVPARLHRYWLSQLTGTVFRTAEDGDCVFPCMQSGRRLVISRSTGRCKWLPAVWILTFSLGVRADNLLGCMKTVSRNPQGIGYEATYVGLAYLFQEQSETTVGARVMSRVMSRRLNSCDLCWTHLLLWRTSPLSD